MTESPTSNILLVKLDHLGDFTFLIPYLGRIQELASGRIGIASAAMNTQWQSLLAVRELPFSIDFPGYGRNRSSLRRKIRLLRDLASLSGKLRQTRWDVAVDLRMPPGDWRGKLVCRLSGAARRVGGPGSGAAFLTHVSKGEFGHESKRISQRLSFALDQQIEESKGPWLKADFASPSRRIILHPGAGCESKKWSPDSWQKLAGLLSRHFTEDEILILGSPSETRDLMGLAGGTRVRIESGTSLVDFVGQIASARLVIGLDSASVHIARLTGTPSVTIFSGANEPERWRALGQNTVITHPVSCAPCHLWECVIPGHPCMSEITPETVFQAAVKAYKCPAPTPESGQSSGSA